MACILLYIFAVEQVLFGGFGNPILLLFAAGEAAAAFGIANEKKWGYGLGVAVSILPIVAILFIHGQTGVGIIISLMFQIALVLLLLHRQSREYQRIWFK
jgi:hypothetical protein